jgi:MFS family permease
MLNESPDRAAIPLRPTRARHVVLALIVAAYVITYMDRVNISSAMPVIQRDLGLSAITVGWIFSSFRWGYALFQIPGGWFGDKLDHGVPSPASCVCGRSSLH